MSSPRAPVSDDTGPEGLVDVLLGVHSALERAAECAIPSDAPAGSGAPPDPELVHILLGLIAVRRRWLHHLPTEVTPPDLPPSGPRVDLLR